MPSGASISVDFDLRGEKTLAKLALQSSAKVQAAVRGVIATYVIKIERKLKQKLAEGGSGQTYSRGGVTHQASAPGEAPATDIGRYRSNIRHELRGLARLRGRVTTDVEYATGLERGTSDVEPRPMWGPVIEEVAGDFVEDVEDAIFQAL